MVSQLCHNILADVDQMGFRLTWKFINIGLYGREEVCAQISHDEMFEYFEILLETECDELEDVIELLCVKKEPFELDKLINELSENEQSDFAFELHKWRLYLLKKILDNRNEDFLQNLLALMEFWLPIRDKIECPHLFPEPDTNSDSVKEYFTEKMHAKLVNRNHAWLQKEIKKVHIAER